MTIQVNGETLETPGYLDFHQKRIERTLDFARSLGAHDVIEVGGHPWVMTHEILKAGFDLQATVSAEEEIAWTDSIEIAKKQYQLDSDETSGTFFNYSANIERDWVPTDQQVDCVFACEIIEHLARSPHRMVLNINQWLKPGGYLILTTPNGAQFSNPLRYNSNSPRYRDAVYSRHNHVYTMVELVDLLDCCGFEITKAEHWQVYPRNGIAQLYDIVGKLPFNWSKQLFTRTLFVVAKKVEDRKTASRLPKVMLPGTNWKDIE